MFVQLVSLLYVKIELIFSIYGSEFEVLEAVPTMAVMDGPLEPSSTARDAPKDHDFVNFFSVSL